MSHVIISREDAAEQKLTHFFTGRPCKYGHLAPRFVSTGGCTECNLGRAARFRKDAPSLFTYPLHPGDVAAVLAYCQACDLQRGRQPVGPGQVVAGRKVRAEASKADIEGARRRALGDAVYEQALSMSATAPRPVSRLAAEDQKALEDHNAWVRAQSK